MTKQGNTVSEQAAVDNQPEDQESTEENRYTADQYVMIQYFEWHLPADGLHWQRLRDDADHLAGLGISGVWLPPCTKGTSPEDVGYGAYDLFDLGEFDQKGTIRTKYGTKEELLEAVRALHDKGLKVYADAVLNHKAGADATERILVEEVNPENRGQAIGEPFEIEAWTRFDYPGRKDRYSSFKWTAHHFTATDYDAASDRTSIFRIIGENKNWSDGVDDEFGNYDYLMFADVDYHHPDVIAETLYWGEWITRELSLDGIRLDAIKHINEDFIEQFARHLRGTFGTDFYVLGEYWKYDNEDLVSYLNETNYHVDLLDVALHFNFHEAGRAGRDYDLRKLFEHTLVASNPVHVVTFVDNHDSQKGQSLESWVADWFKPLAYALILLRKDGYPCLFYGDYYGTGGDHSTPAKQEMLDKLLHARHQYAYGKQVDYFDHANTVGWLRFGIDERPGSGLAVVISNGDEGYKHMAFGPERAGTTWLDLTGSRSERITLDEQGEATFLVNGGSVSVWAQQNQD